MTDPAHHDDPLAEPAEPRTGGDVGSVRPKPGSAPAARHADRIDPVDADARRENDEEDDDESRHPPVAPVDETHPVRSLGKAVGEVLTGSEPATPARPEH